MSEETIIHILLGSVGLLCVVVAASDEYRIRELEKEVQDLKRKIDKDADEPPEPEPFNGFSG